MGGSGRECEYMGVGAVQRIGVDVRECMAVVVDRVKTGVVGDCPCGYKAEGQWDGKE